MILKRIYLYPDLGEYDDDFIQIVRNETRHICGFIERNIKLNKHSTKDFNKICFVGRLEPNDTPRVNSSGALIIEFKLMKDEYKKLQSGELAEFYLKILSKEIAKISNLHPLVCSDIIKAIDLFRIGDYRNTWIFKTKTDKKSNVTAKLICNHTKDYFSLSLHISDSSNGKEYEIETIKVEPDEIVFDTYLEDIQFIGNKIELVDKFGNSFYNVDIGHLRQDESAEQARMKAKDL